MRCFLLYYMIFLFSVCLGSCVDDQRVQAETLVKTWYGEQLSFSEKFPCFVLGHDTTDYSVFKKPCKVLVYVTPTDCVECQLHLDQWSSFYEQIPLRDSVGIIFIFRTAEYDQISLVFKREGFIHPYYFDDKGSLFNEVKQHQYPGTFVLLLNRKNEVVVVGSPITNERIRDLFTKNIRSIIGI